MRDTRAFPCNERSIDRIIGTLHTQDLLVKVLEGEEFSIRTLAREAFFVPESKLITELLSEFKVRRQHLAIVVDEYGGTAGIVTLEMSLRAGGRDPRRVRQRGRAGASP